MVEKRFEKLGMPDIERFENYLPTAFNSELTLLQKVNKIIFDLMETNKLTNEMIDYLNQFIETFDEKLYGTIEDVLTVWLEDGRLADIVRVAINDEVIEARTDYLGKKYVNLKARLDSEKAEVTAQLAERATNVINILEYKHLAVGDDWTVAFQTAFNEVGVNKTLFIPGGSYRIKDTVIRKTALVLKGVGKNTVIINEVPKGKSCIYFDGGLVWPGTNFSIISDLVIQGNGDCGSGLRVNRFGYSTIENISLIRNENGLEVESNSYGTSVYNVFCKLNTKSGVSDVGGNKLNYNWYFNRLTVEESKNGIVWGSPDLVLEAPLIQDVTDSHIIVSGKKTIINNTYLEAFDNIVKPVIKVTGYGSTLNNIGIHANNSTGRIGIDYNAHVKVKNAYLQELDKGIVFSGSSATNSSFLDVTYDGVTTKIVRGSDNAIFSDSYRPTMNTVSIDTISTLLNSSRNLNIDGGIIPTQHQTHNLGSPSNGFLYSYMNRVHLKWGVQFTPTTEIGTLNSLYVDASDGKLKFRNKDNIVTVLS